jgi:hypothetical protein
MSNEVFLRGSPLALALPTSSAPSPSPFLPPSSPSLFIANLVVILCNPSVPKGGVSELRFSTKCCEPRGSSEKLFGWPASPRARGMRQLWSGGWGVGSPLAAP